jgi:hypothetical protein
MTTAPSRFSGLCVPSDCVTESVVEIPPADESRVLFDRVMVASISEPSIVTTPSPGETVGASGAGIVVVVVVVVDDVVVVAPALAPLATVVVVARGVDPDEEAVVVDVVEPGAEVTVVDEEGAVRPMLTNALLWFPAVALDVMVIPVTVPEILTMPVPNPLDCVMVVLLAEPFVMPDTTETDPEPPEVATLYGLASERRYQKYNSGFVMALAKVKVRIELAAKS